MKSVLSAASSLLSSLRNSMFIVMFLLSGNYHQAVEKQSDSRASENDISFLYAPSVRFTTQYSSYIENKLDSLLKRRNFNGSVMVSHKGQAVYNKSFGFSSFNDNREFSEEKNIFQLASVGKQFTAMATLILYERNLIGLDDPVAMHIDRFPYADITIRHLLNHTSGLQNYFSVIENHWKKDKLPVHDDMLDLIISRSLPLNFAPGRQFSYSNTGYAFLAMLVEKVSHEPFAEFVQRNIFDVLNMDNSFVFHPDFNITQSGLTGNLTMGYERMGRRLREIPVDNVDGITGDKGIFSCTEDLLKWDTALENNLLISEETRKMAFESGQLRNGRKINYGFGFRIRSGSDQNIIYHNGWWRGFRTAYVRLPENTLIVVLNNTNASINGLEEQIQAIMSNSPVPVFSEEKMLLAMHNNIRVQ
jgi:CubicO group peptidase (beta-lactamase class C family)